MKTLRITEDLDSEPKVIEEGDPGAIQEKDNKDAEEEDK